MKQYTLNYLTHDYFYYQFIKITADSYIKAVSILADIEQDNLYIDTVTNDQYNTNEVRMYKDSHYIAPE